MIEVIPIGTNVRLGPDCTGLVTGITIRFHDTVCYEITFWDGLCRRQEWMFAEELQAETEERQRIGFQCPPQAA